MKKIIFVRHGKAEDEVFGLSDFERSLTTAGKKISIQMAKTFLAKENSMGVIISSPAFRALETALIFADHKAKLYDGILIRNDLYAGTNLKKVLDLLRTLDNKEDKVTLFGHNPSFSDIPDNLSKTGCSPLPKSGVICLSFKSDKWEDIEPQTGTVEYFLKPEK